MFIVRLVVRIKGENRLQYEDVSTISFYCSDVGRYLPHIYLLVFAQIITHEGLPYAICLMNYWPTLALGLVF